MVTDVIKPNKSGFDGGRKSVLDNRISICVSLEHLHIENIKLYSSDDSEKTSLRIYSYSVISIYRIMHRSWIGGTAFTPTSMTA